MRKRQWKKILSVVLALAMVFSMNVSAFADEVTDPVPAVEETATEQPVAETPADSSEETPIEETKEEEPAAPAEEPAKAEEPAGAAPAGWDVTGTEGTDWSSEDDSHISSVADGGDFSITETATEGNDLTLTLASDAVVTVVLNSTSNNKVTLATDAFDTTAGEVYANGTELTANGSYTLIKIGTAVEAVEYDDAGATGGKGKLKFKTAYATGYTLHDSTGDVTSTVLEAKATPTDAAIAASTVVVYKAGEGAKYVSAVTGKAAQTAPGVTTIALANEGTTVNITDSAGDASSREYRYVETEGQPGRGDAANVTGTSFTGTAGKTYYVYARLKADASNYSSDWSATSKSITLDAPEPPAENSFTVSGYTFELGDNTVSTGSISTDNAYGIWTVKLSLSDNSKPGTVTLKGTAEKAISINLAGVELDVTSAITDYSHMSITGAGTIVTNGLTSSPSYAKSFEKVAKDVQISGNSAGILISGNNLTDGKASYAAVLKGTDAAYKVPADSRILIVGASAQDPKMESSKLPMDNTLLEGSATKILSGNGAEFTTLTAEQAGALKVSDNRYEGISVLFGERVILVSNAASLEGAKVIDVPQKGISKWINRFVTGMNTSEGINVQYDTEQKAIAGQYQFTLSNNATTGLVDANKDGAVWTGGNDDSGLIKKLVTAGNAESGKNYVLFGQKISTATEYKSDVFEVCSFTTLKKATLSINLTNATLSPNYIGDVPDYDTLEKLQSNTNVVNKNFFTFTPHDYGQTVTVEENYDPYYEKYIINDNKYVLKDSDGFELGDVEVVFGKYNTDLDPAHIDWLTWSGAYYYQLPVNNGDGFPYVAKVKFTPYDSAQTVYNGYDSFVEDKNIVSFNVIKAPVKYEPVVSPVVVSGNVLEAPSFKATNTLTGFDATDVVNESGTKDVFYYIDGKKADAASWNKLAPGSYTISISQGSLVAKDNYAVVKDKEQADYSATATVKVVDPKGSEGLKVTGKLVDPVYYGESTDDVKASISASFTFGGVDVTNGMSKAYTGKIKFLKSPSSNAKAATDEITDTKTVSGNTKIYAYFIDVEHSVAGKTLDPVSSDAIEITVQPRPVVINTKTGDPIKSYRGEPAKVSVNKADLSVYVVDDDSYYDKSKKTWVNVPAYAGEAVTAEALFANDKFINLDTSAVNTNVPKNSYDAALTGYTLSADKVRNYAQNYVVVDDNVEYQILGKWYVKYILEYGGRGATAGKRYVSSDEVIVEAEDGSKNFIGDYYKFTPSKKLTNSWNQILPEGDTITKWEIKEADSLNDVTHREYDSTDTPVTGWTRNAMQYGLTAEVELADYDYAVYAVVAAKATKEGVMVESITPVRYDGMAHVTTDDTNEKKSESDLELVLYDEKTIAAADLETQDKYFDKGYRWNRDEGTNEIWRKYLVQGDDYTVSYKNNKNASVAYDNTVSGDDGVDATFKRIVSDKQMPQIIVKGKGDFKSLKTTVLFDILPRSANGWGYGTQYQLAGKTLNTKLTVNDYIWTTRYTKGKTYKLKLGKSNAKKLSGYTGDYVTEVYKVADNGTKTKVTDFKKIAEGNYQVVAKFVNNYYGQTVYNITVKKGDLLSKQTIKFKKSIAWASGGIKAADFITKVTTKKKPKTDLVLIKESETDDKAGYFIDDVDSKTGVGYEYDPATEAFTMKDAGEYTITLKASNKLMETNGIIGTHTIKVTVKGVKLKASDFMIDGKKASKTVIVDYDGNSKAVAVTLAKPSKFPVDNESKIPMAMPTVKKQEASKEDAVDAADADGIDETWGGFNEETGAYNNGYSSSTTEYYDTGVRLSAALSGKGVYTVSPKAFNSSLFSDYKICIRPSGKYYTGTSNAYITLTYKRGGLNLKKVVGGDLFKVEAVEVPVNVGGTPADLHMTIAGMTPEKNANFSYYASGNKIYLTNGAPESTSKKGYVKWAGENILEVTYSKNKKVGTAVATIKPTKAGKNYFKGSAKVNYNIKTNEVKKVREYAVDAMDNGEVFAVITDAAKADKMSCVLYQMDACGSGKATKLGTKDYKAALGKEDAKKGYTVAITDGTSGNFKFAKDTLVKNADETDNAYFNVYGKKVKMKATLSQGSGSGYDAAKKGYVYTGKEINPGVTELILGKDATYSFPAGLTESSNFIVTYNNNVKVGTASATITMKRDLTSASANTAYPYGGSVTVKFKIVPHTNENLILSE